MDARPLRYRSSGYCYSLKEIRKLQDVSQVALSLRTGLSTAHISELENLRFAARHGTLKILADALDCSVEDITKKK